MAPRPVPAPKPADAPASVAGFPIIKHLARLQGTSTAHAADVFAKLSEDTAKLELLAAATAAQCDLVKELHSHPAGHANPAAAYQRAVDADKKFLEAIGG